MCNPVLKQRSSILLSSLVIIGPQYATFPSHIDSICCLRTSSNSGIGHPRALRRRNTHILAYALLQMYSVLDIVFISERIMVPRILYSSTTSVYIPGLMEMSGAISKDLRGLKIIVFVLLLFRLWFLCSHNNTILSTSSCNILHLLGIMCSVRPLYGTGLVGSVLRSKVFFRSKAARTVKSSIHFFLVFSIFLLCLRGWVMIWPRGSIFAFGPAAKISTNRLELPGRRRREYPSPPRLVACSGLAICVGSNIQLISLKANLDSHSLLKGLL